MGAAFKSGSEECPCLAGPGYCLAQLSPPFQEAQPCQLPCNSVLGIPWTPLSNTSYLLGLAGTLPGLRPGTMTLPSGFVTAAHEQGTPRVLFNRVLFSL